MKRYVVLAVLLSFLITAGVVLAVAPGVQTNPATGVTPDSATLNGEVTGMGNQTSATRPLQIGAISVQEDPTSNPAFTVSVGIGATLAVLQYSGGDNCGTITATLGGAAMTSLQTATGGPAGLFQTEVFYRINPSSGSQTLQLGSANGCNSGYSHVIMFSSWSGTHATVPMTIGTSQNGGNTCFTGTHTLDSGEPSADQYTLVTIMTTQDIGASCASNNGRVQSPNGFVTSWGFGSTDIQQCDGITPRQCGSGGVSTSVATQFTPVSTGVNRLALYVGLNGITAIVTCSEITARFQWGTSPTLSAFSETSSQVLTEPGDYSEGLTGLSSGTYYFRAVATNSCGTASGAILSFTTANAALYWLLNGGLGLIVFFFALLFMLVLVMGFRRWIGGRA
jgi:hypothetical protein